MTDEKIVELFLQRDEGAIEATAEKYGGYCYKIALNVLGGAEDSEECVNDTYMKAWNSIPPAHPRKLAAFLGAVTRNLALDRVRRSAAKKRVSANLTDALDELSYCVSGEESPEDVVAKLSLEDTVNGFLDSLRERDRDIFVERYWFLESVSVIAKKRGISENRVSASLYRTRKALREELERKELL